MNMAMPILLLRWRFHLPAQLRIDVEQLRPRWSESLTEIYDRIQDSRDPLHELPAFLLPDEDLRLRVRLIDGEQHCYVEDLRRGRLAGCTVFNRMNELYRSSDAYLRSPHSLYGAAYQRRGIATAVYAWALQAGTCLMTGARQSVGAHALWRKLASRYVSGFAAIDGRKLIYLGNEVTPRQLDRLETRMFLLGEGWSLERFQAVHKMSTLHGH